MIGLQERQGAARRSDGHNQQRLWQTERCQPRWGFLAAHTPEEKMTMSKMTLKLMLAGVFVGCALIALRAAWATPAVETFTTFIAGPVTLDEIKIGGDTDGV